MAINWPKKRLKLSTKFIKNSLLNCSGKFIATQFIRRNVFNNLLINFIDEPFFKILIYINSIGFIKILL
jgi:hypothetical protein